MKTTETDCIVNINPDCMTRDEVLELEQNLRLLADYCKLKAEAMFHRTNGNIQHALFLEQACDDCYLNLPDNYKSW